MAEDIFDKIPSEVILRTQPRGEFSLKVDGEEFPWFITEDGVKIERLREDLYTVAMEIFLIDTSDTTRFLPLDFIYDSCNKTPSIPIIDGREFPWLLTQDDRKLTFGAKRLPTLTLAFFAQNVDSDAWIKNGRDVFCEGGHRIAVRA